MATHVYHKEVSKVKPPAYLQIDSDKYTSWKKLIQQFEWYVTANQLEEKSDDVQTATFMTVIDQRKLKFTTVSILATQIKITYKSSRTVLENTRIKGNHIF